MWRLLLDEFVASSHSHHYAGVSCASCMVASFPEDAADPDLDESPLLEVKIALERALLLPSSFY